MKIDNLKNSSGIWIRFKRNKMAVLGLIILFILSVCAIFAQQIAPYPPEEQHLSDMLLSPCSKYIMGTDNFGRDIFTRIIYGARISLVVGLLSVGIGMTVGGALGAIAAYYSGKTDAIIMRVMDVMISIPSIILAISISAALGPGLLNVMLAVGIGTVPTYTRVTRSSVLTIKGQEYVEAARAIGTKDYAIIAKHIIPNALSPIIVQATLGVGSAILVAASLSFIGLGVQPPTPEWGSMLSAGRTYIRDHSHTVLFPGIAIMLTVFSLNLLGDGLRDALDPRMKR